MAWYSTLTDPFARTYARLAVVATALSAALRTSPPRPGISSGRVATQPLAESDLAALATSPTVYGAITRRALSLANYPVVVYRGFSLAGGKLERLDPSRPWVAAFYRLLQRPDPTTRFSLAPLSWERLCAQIIADLIQIGSFIVLPTVGESGYISGLTRLHPGSCAIERLNGVDELVYVEGNERRRYPLDQVFIGALLSWQRNGRQAFGVGAGTPMRYLTRAEGVAIEQTANMIEQGGADLRIVGKGATGKNFMANKENREKALDAVIQAIKGPNGRRVIAVSDDIEINDGGLKPTDLRAPELHTAARQAALVATGTCAAWVGIDAGTYANAAMQFRVQADADEGICSVVEAGLLRPLAQHFARVAGGRDGAADEQITSRQDLSQHPGYAQLRTESIARVKSLVHDMGYTVDQAKEIEGFGDWASPEGEILSAGQPTDSSVPGPETGSTLDAPRDPVGANGDQHVSNPKANESRSVIRLSDRFGRVP
jgi:hypothetical protein